MDLWTLDLMYMIIICSNILNAHCSKATIRLISQVSYDSVLNLQRAHSVGPHRKNKNGIGISIKAQRANKLVPQAVPSPSYCCSINSGIAVASVYLVIELAPFAEAPYLSP